jgi:site-specific recombinase XerD
MTGVKDAVLFQSVHDFINVNLPNQRKCSQHTIRSYRHTLKSLLNFVKTNKQIPLSKVTFKMLDAKMIIAFLDSMEEANNWSISTRNQRLNTIRSFFHYAADFDPTATIYRTEVDKVAIKKQEKNYCVEHLNELAMKTVIEQPNTSTAKGLRNRFLMILLYDTGARIQELLNIRLQDLRIEKASTSTVTLYGKNSKIRSVPLMEKTVSHLHDYLKAFHNGETLCTERPLFYVLRDGIPKFMCTDNARRIIKGYGKKAKMVCADVPDVVRPHLFRHSRAMHLYRHGMDLSLVSQWLGHAQFETTLIYARADTGQKRKAIEKATPKSNPLNAHFNADRYTITDDDTLMRLCGLE